MTRDEIIEGLRSTYGKEFTAADVRDSVLLMTLLIKQSLKKLKSIQLVVVSGI